MYLEMLFNACNINKADVSVCGMKCMQKYSTLNEEIINDNISFIKNPYDKILKKYRSVCGHLYRAEMLKGVIFPYGVRYAEDMIFNYELLNSRDSIDAIIVEAPLYYYYQNQYSTTHDKNESDRVSTVLCCIDKLYKYKTNYSYLFFDLALKITFVYRYHLFVFCELKENKKTYIKMKKICLKSTKGWRELQWTKKVIYFIFLNMPCIYRKYMVKKDPSLLKWEQMEKKNREKE